ncbi:MAG: DNA primase [Alphaproteobacteria bacterium]|nr:MAG: DNA primase [Alphaproteobacteria bacterium]
MSILDEILSKIRLSAIIGKDVKLKLNGHEYLGCCPFHKEKTPSFRVNDKKGLYYCFGCQVKGNAFTYLNQKMSKKDTIETLAKMAGVKLEPLKQQAPIIKSQIELYRRACDLFKQSLTRDVLSYLNQRGITKKSIEIYELGYCPQGDELFNALSPEFPQDMLNKSELFTGKKCRFRGRLMFPIKNYRGHVIAFGGRILDGSSNAKYINSKETEIFKKSEVLYGFHEADKKKKFIITEGYLDVIKVQQAGEFSAVAPLGTSFSKAQAEQIWTYDERPFVCFDGDQAGKTAAYRLIERMTPFLTAEKSFAFLDLPQGEDADSFAKDLSTLKPISFADKLFEKICLKKQLTSPEDQAFIKEEIIRITKTQQNQALSNAFRQYLLNKLWEASKHKSKTSKDKNHKIPTLPKAQYREILAGVLLATLVKYPELLEDIQDYLGRLEFENPGFEALKYKLLERYFDETVTINTDALNIKKLTAYAPFLDKPKEEKIKDIWIDIYTQYLNHTPQKSQSWEEIQASKKSLIVDQSD